MDINYLDYLDDDLNYDWLEQTIRVPKRYLRDMQNSIEG